MIIDKQKIRYSDASLVDDFGRVFFYEQRVFRAIYFHHESYCRKLLGSRLLEELIEQGYLPNTWITDYTLDGYSLIIEHEVLAESKPHHWSFSMFKEAALTLLTVNAICNSHGYELKDAHPYNIFFKCHKPVFIDIGSILPRKHKDKWSAQNQFMDSVYIQLLLWCIGDFFLARKLIEDGNRSALRTIPMTPILDAAFMRNIQSEVFQFEFFFKNRSILTTNRYYQALRVGAKLLDRVAFFLLRTNRKMISYKRVLRSVPYVRRKIMHMTRPIGKSAWQSYHCAYKKDSELGSTPRFDRILELVKIHAQDIDSAIDLAGNQGIFCSLLSKQFSLKRIVLTDYDENAIDNAYHTFKDQKANIQPYLFNFMKPVRYDEILSVKCDIVFALAITHHLILTQRYSLSAILGRIGEYSNKYVVVEFMPIGLWDGNEVKESIPNWYSVDWFRSQFENAFELVVEEKLEVNRVVFIGSKKVP